MSSVKRINLKLPAKASMWYLCASATSKAVGFLITPFFTRMISGQAYGELTLYLTLVGIASVICSSVNTGSTMYKNIKTYESEKGSLLRSALLVSLSYSAVICLFLFTFRGFFGIKTHLFIPLSLQILCDGIIAVTLSSAKFSYRYKEVTSINILSSVFPAIITLALLNAVKVRFRVRVYSLLAISICLAIYSIIKIFKSDGKANRKMCSSLIKSSVPLLPNSISLALSGQADKLIITSYLGTVALAKYSVIHSLGVALQFAVGAIGFALGPWMIRRLEVEDYCKISTLAGLLISGFSALSLCLIAIAPEIMKILAPGEYLDAFPAFLPIALTTPFSLLYSVITICLINSNRQRETVTVSLIGAMTSLLLNFTLVPKLSYLGAGLSLFLSQALSVTVGIYLIFNSRLGQTLSPSKIISTFIPTIILGVFLFLSFNNPALRVLILIVPTLMLIKDFYRLKLLILE